MAIEQFLEHVISNDLGFIFLDGMGLLKGAGQILLRGVSIVGQKCFYFHPISQTDQTVVDFGRWTLSKLVTAGFFFFCFTFVSCSFSRHGFDQVICEVLDILRNFGHVQHFGRVVAGRQRSKGLL